MHCWAACIGGCCDEQSREHWVSEAVFAADKVRVQGLRWCKEEPSIIGLANATSKVLCKTHNSALSPLDAAAGRAFDAMRDSMGTVNRHRATLMPWQRPAVERFKIDAGLLERWLVKTAINLALIGRPVRIGDDGGATHEVPRSWAEIAFGIRPFQGHAGMYIVAAAGSKQSWEDDIAFVPLLTDDNQLVAAGFKLFGLRALLWMRTQQPVPASLDQLSVLGPEWAGAAPHWRFKSLAFKLGIWPSNYIDLDWTSALRQEGIGHATIVLEPPAD